MRALRRLAIGACMAAMLALIALAALAHFRRAPGDAPWAPLDLADPPGLFTAAKIASLAPGACRAVLARAGVGFVRLPDRHEGACGYADGVRLLPGGARQIALAPAGIGLSCRVGAGLSLWEWQVVQAAARGILGSVVARIEHIGSYNCRRVYGRATGSWSEHAHANAIDITGFRLADGRHITVAGDWADRGARGIFLHAVRDGACGMFETVLSPDYNAAHHDHLHLDEAARPMGWRACR